MLKMVTDTSIGISKETKKRLEGIKQYPRETFDDILNRLLDMYDKKFEQKEITD